MSYGIYDFEEDDYQSIKESSFDKLHGLGFEGNFAQVQQALLDLVCGKQKDKFANRGYVMVVNGPWGAGKTTLTWALVNEMRASIEANDLAADMLVVDRSFLPFGNVSESIALFLKELADKLWRSGAVDVRKDMEQFILEATPTISQNEYTAGFGIGPFSVSKPMKLKPKDITHEVMVSRLKTLAPQCRTVVLVLDDLDRLRPSEIVQVMRMVEKLRTLPRVFIVLPIYKYVVTEAFHAELNLPAGAAPTFLRKLTDIEVKIENSLSDISQTFCNAFSAQTRTDFAQVLKPYGLSIEVMCWLMLMHNIIPAEAVLKAEDMKQTGESPSRLFNGVHSQYVHALQQLFFAHTRITSGPHKHTDPYPSHYRQDTRGDGTLEDVFAPLGLHYGDIANNPGSEESVKQLGESRNVDNVLKLITKDSTLVQELQAGGQTTFDKDREAASSVPVITEVFLPLLQNSTDEPLITDNYKLRDVKLLARMVQAHPKFNKDSESILADTYIAVKESFDAFRF